MSHQYTFKSLLLLTFLSSNITICLAQEEVEGNPIDQEILNELSLENLYELPIVEIATGTAVPLEKAPSVASLITAADIKAMGAVTINEVLESVPGLHVSQSTLLKSENISIRGIKTSFTPQTLILLNGYRISSDVYSSSLVDGSVINVQNISRIEVIRGPGSAIYGADAFSGVINIITKSAKEMNGLHIGGRGGSDDMQNIWTQYGGDLGNGWELALNLEYAKQSADKSRTMETDLQSTLDGIFLTNASLAPSYFDDRYQSTSYNIHLSNEHWKFGLDGWVQRDNGTGAGIAQAIDHKGHYDIDQSLFSLEYNNKDWLDSWRFTGKASYAYSKSESQLNIFPAGALLAVGTDGNAFSNPVNGLVSFTDGYIGNPSHKSKTPKFEVIALYDGLNAHTWRFNAGWKKESLEASEEKNFGPSIIDGTLSPISGSLTNVTDTAFVFIPDKSRTIHYLSMQDIWEFDVDWTLTAGLRYDKYSDFGDTTNFRGALVWTPTDKLIAKLLYATAFRAPSFTELYAQNNPVGLGNPNLDPEEIKTTELAFTYEVTDTFTTGLNLYHYNAQSMIDFVPNGDGTNTTQNIHDLTGKGIELEASWNINKQWQLMANYAYQSTKNDDTHTQVAFVPKQQFYLDARWKFQPKWELSGQLNWVADREREVGDNRDDIDNYTLLNMTLRRKDIRFANNKGHWEIAASIKNVFNEKAYAPSSSLPSPSIANDYPLNERQFYAEIRYHID